MKPIYLVDASPYIFRAFFSIPPSVKAPDGKPANAIYGFGGFLLKLIEDEDVSHMALAFDRSLNTSFRNDIYPDYKAQRELPPEALKNQLDGCESLGQAFGIKTFSSDSFEAEDLLGSLLGPLRAAGHEVILVSSDKDLMQLVDEGTSLFDLARDDRYGPAEVQGKFGVRPNQIADYLALAGDSVDNIPGVPGIGKKTAAALLEHFDTVESLLDNADKVADLKIRGARSLAKKLHEHRAMAELSKRLSVIARHAEVEATAEDLRIRGLDQERFDELVKVWGFTRFKSRVRQWHARWQEADDDG